MKSSITNELISGAYTYEEYNALIKQLLSENKTTGTNQSEKNIYFTKLNVQRAKRIENTTVIEESLNETIEKISVPLIFLVIAEAWCGDVVQNLPIINKIVALNPIIELKIILRDENESIMNEFLTNGAKAIPVCLILNKSNLDVVARWGPRPGPAQAMMLEYKKTKSITYDDVAKNIQLWYANDKTKTIQKEFLELFGNLFLGN